ncbi:MAG TPA: hypothetical protein VGM33_06480 [Baekduia sp.]
MALATALALGCGSGDDGKAKVPPAATGILAGTKFAVPPVVLFTAVEGAGGGYTVYARLTRDLPRDGNGAVAASFNITSNPDAVQGNPTSTRGSRRRHCFQQAISSLSTKPSPTDAGTRVTLTLTAHDRHHRRGTLTTAVRLAARDVHGNVSEGPYPKRVGC